LCSVIPYLSAERLDGTYSTMDTEAGEESIGSSIMPPVKAYDGFTSPAAQTVAIISDWSTSITYRYVRNSYPVPYIDRVDSTSGEELGRQTVSRKSQSAVRGSNIGGSTADNAYHNKYYYVLDTTGTVELSGATVYRIFRLRTSML